jgi:hypothetical protein
MTARALGIPPGGSQLVRPSGAPARIRPEIQFAAVAHRGRVATRATID